MGEERETIRAKAPLRISFCGGGSDVSPYFEEHGGVVLSATINKYSYATLSTNSSSDIHVRSLDYGLSVKYDVDQDLRYDGKLDLVKGVLNRMKVQRGVNLFLHADAPPGSGMGSSSSMVVAIVGLLKEFLRQPWGPYEVAEFAYRIERVDLAIKGGKQDQYAAAFGGFNLIEFRKDATVVTPLRIAPNILSELEYNLMLCYTGQTRLSAGLIDRQIRDYKEGRSSTLAALGELKRLTYEMKDALVLGNLYEFGCLLHEAAEKKREMNPDCYTPDIDRLYETARQHGVIGGKILGAGAGGHMLLFCPFDRKHVVAAKLEEHGARVIPFGFDDRGLQTWRVEPDPKAFAHAR